jgi:tRNA 2-thiouridine synthesizing protein C
LCLVSEFRTVKKILFVLRKPPHSGAYAQELLDIIMTVAAFDQETSVLLLDKAVFQIKKQQNPESAGLKDTAAIFKALPLYNINAIYVESESLEEQGLTVESLDEAVQAIPRNKVPELMKQFDVLLSG